MRARDRGRAYGQIVALGAGLAVFCTAAPGTAVAEPVARRQPQEQPGQPAQQRVLKIYVVGDSYSSGEGIKGVARGGRTSEANSYFDSADPRHQSTLNAASQAAARLQEANPGVQVEIHIVASSGATTSDVFKTQRRDPLEKIPGNTPQDPVDQGTWHESNDLAVNFPQLDQIPADADAVIMGFGGNDAFFGPLAESFVFEQWSRNTMLTREALGLLENGNTDATYRAQARMNQPGYAPTLIARLLQVQEAIQKRAPNAKMIFQIIFGIDSWRVGLTHRGGYHHEIRNPHSRRKPVDKNKLELWDDRHLSGQLCSELEAELHDRRLVVPHWAWAHLQDSFGELEMAGVVLWERFPVRQGQQVIRPRHNAHCAPSLTAVQPIVP